MKENMNRGLSLVELSIVLVILGLLTGGILAGQSLIRASELRSVTADLSRHMTAVQTFRDKYFAIPGDMTNATKFWGTDTASACSTSPVAGDRVSKTATCDGDGNGAIASNHPETFRIWQHLANAGLIEGSYTGVDAGGGVGGAHTAGVNCPRLRISNGGASAFWHGNVAVNHPYLFEGNYGNSFIYGQCGAYECVGGLFKPEETWNIDTKLDDGRPGLGKVVVRSAVSATNCSDTSSTAAGAASAANYALTQTGNNCGIYVRGTF